jgi:hypothetical protein
MRWWRDPPTVVDAVVTPDTTNTPPAAGPACEGDIVWTFTYTIVQQHATGPILYGGYAGLHISAAQVCPP